MCQFNLAIVDLETDDLKLKEIFEQNGLHYMPIRIKDLEKHIGFDYKVIFTTKGHCDCGSGIGYDSKDNSTRREIEKEIKKLKLKKWSDNKINQYLKNKEKSEKQKQANELLQTTEEIDRWINTINDCFATTKIKRFGVLTHFYSGVIEVEIFDSVKLENINTDINISSKLKLLDFDKLLLINN